MCVVVDANIVILVVIVLGVNEPLRVLMITLLLVIIYYPNCFGSN